MEALKEKILNTLEKLDDDELDNFKGRLLLLPGEEKLEKSHVTNKNKIQLTSKIVEMYDNETKVAELMFKILRAIKRNDLAKQFQAEASGNSAATAQGTNSAQAGVPVSDPDSQFVVANRDELISRVRMVDPILDLLIKEGVIDQEGYDLVRAETISMTKMRKLFALLTTRKDRKAFYRGLEKHEKNLLDELKSQ